MNPSREAQLRKLKSLIRSSETQLTAILEKLKWSKDEVLKKKEYVVCPIDPGHTMPESLLDKHLDLCAWLKEGYSRQEKEAAPPSSHFFYTKSTSVVPVLIDRETQSRIITDAAFRGDVPAHLASAAATITMLFVARLVYPRLRISFYFLLNDISLIFNVSAVMNKCVVPLLIFSISVSHICNQSLNSFLCIVVQL